MKCILGERNRIYPLAKRRWEQWRGVTDTALKSPALMRGRQQEEGRKQATNETMLTPWGPQKPAP